MYKGHCSRSSLFYGMKVEITIIFIQKVKFDNEAHQGHSISLKYDVRHFDHHRLR